MDIGGTFTDVVRYDERTGAVVASKVPSTPGDLVEGVFSALGRVVDDLSGISHFVHGTTQGLNALLERKGGRDVTAEPPGVPDVYQIARDNGAEAVERCRKPEPLVPRVGRHGDRRAAGRRGEELIPPERGRRGRGRPEGSGASVSTRSRSACCSATSNPAHEIRVEGDPHTRSWARTRLARPLVPRGRPRWREGRADLLRRCWRPTRAPRSATTWAGSRNGPPSAA